MNKKKFTESLFGQLNIAMKNTQIKTASELARSIQAVGYDVSEDSVIKYVRGETVPGAYALAAMAIVLSDIS